MHVLGWNMDRWTISKVNSFLFIYSPHCRVKETIINSKIVCINGQLISNGKVFIQYCNALDETQAWHMAFFNTSCLCPIYFSEGPLFTHQYIEVQDTNQVLQQEKNIENSKDKGNTKLKAWQCDTSGILFHNLKSVCNVYVKIVDGYNSYKYKGLYMEYSHHSTCIRVRWS